MLSMKLATGGLALALSLGALAGLADARTAGSHKHPANHGATVSAVAKSDATTGEAHGDAVSAAAHAKVAAAKDKDNDNDTDVDNDTDNDEDNDNDNDGMKAIAMGLGAKISALAKATTGAGKGDTISDAAQTHGATVSAHAKARH